MASFYRYGALGVRGQRAQASSAVARECALDARPKWTLRVSCWVPTRA